MIKMTGPQITILLAFYYFDFKKADDKKIKNFAGKYISYFKLDTSVQNIIYSLSLFKNVDPSFNSMYNQSGDEDYKKIWKYYIEEDRIDFLRKEYLNFKNNIKQEKIIVNVNDNSFNELLDLKINDFKYDDIIDQPKPKYDYKKDKSSGEPRDLNVAFNALKKANFKCEVDSNHFLFIRKNSNINYTEGHHLIPLKYQDMFDVNLDVEANIVSLCSNCHNLIHYGKDYVTLISKLFNERKSRLDKCGIHITLEELLKLYE